MPSRLTLVSLSRAFAPRPLSAPRSLRKSPHLARFSQSTRVNQPRKNSQDKDSIDTEANEYTKSGTDDGAARQEDAAFDPNLTKPDEEHSKAGEGTDQNPLDVSPANPEVSKQRPQQEGGAEKSPKENGDSKGSGFGSPKKSG